MNLYRIPTTARCLVIRLNGRLCLFVYHLTVPLEETE